MKMTTGAPTSGVMALTGSDEPVPGSEQAMLHAMAVAAPIIITDGTSTR